MDVACETDSHVNYGCLDTSQMFKRMRKMHEVIAKKKGQVKSLQNFIL